jgi:hypothetical protein
MNQNQNEFMEWWEEITRINMEFWGICRAYEANKMGTSIDNLDIFLKFEELWNQFCVNWKGKPRLIEANPEAFRQWAIHQEPMPRTWKWPKNND